MQGANRPQTTQMSAAIKFILKQHKFKAGKFTIGYQTCDDSTAQAGKWDSAKCTSNARAYAGDKSVIGIIGTFNSGCAKLEIPILNRAGLLGMVSPANTAVGLTVAANGSNPGEPKIYYPTGKRNYIRVVTRDDIQGPAGALWASTLKKKKVYILTDRETYGLGVANTFKGAAKKLGIATVGPEAWDAKQSSYEALGNKIKQSGATAVYFGGIVCNNGAKLVKDLGGVLGKGVTLIGPDGWTPFSATAAAGSAAQGMYVTVPGAPASALKGTGKQFVKSFSKTQGGKQIQAYVSYAAQSADVLLTAISKSNGTRASVTKNLFKTKVKNGILGTFKIDKNGDTNLKGITVYKIKGTDGVPVKTLYPTAKLTG
jgi:branched-chain amino acid transport system substrate-binding protein